MRVASLPLLALNVRAAVAGAQCADSLARRDCRNAKSQGYCYVYADECRKTCGCTKDWTQRRKKKGLDDAYYNSPDFQCVNGDDFKDYQGFDCTLYEGARWCVVDEGGEVTEGPGWCDWFHPGDCDIKRSLRWPHHENYANEDGQWAKSCCCNTGVAETYPYEGGGACVDLLNPRGGAWHDSNGYSCRAYHFGKFCTPEGEAGSGWSVETYGDIADYAYDGMSPIEACCACGQQAPGNDDDYDYYYDY